MTPKFNKQTGRWGIWLEVKAIDLRLWLTHVLTSNPLRFQSKQEAAAHIARMRAAA